VGITEMIWESIAVHASDIHPPITARYPALQNKKAVRV
jgi:hypothetical protein